MRWTLPTTSPCPLLLVDDGVAAGEAVECLSANAAVMRAEALSRKPGCAGAVAFSRSGDPATGEFGDAKLIRKFGDVPGRPERAVKPDYPPSECSRKKRSISLVASGPRGSV